MKINIILHQKKKRWNCVNFSNFFKEIRLKKYQMFCTIRGHFHFAPSMSSMWHCFSILSSRLYIWFFVFCSVCSVTVKWESTKAYIEEVGCIWTSQVDYWTWELSNDTHIAVLFLHWFFRFLILSGPAGDGLMIISATGKRRAHNTRARNVRSVTHYMIGKILVIQLHPKIRYSAFNAALHSLCLWE